MQISEGSRNETKNSKFLTGKYKRQQLIKHPLFTADVDIKSKRRLKILYK